MGFRWSDWLCEIFSFNAVFFKKSFVMIEFPACLHISPYFRSKFIVLVGMKETVDKA